MCYLLAGHNNRQKRYFENENAQGTRFFRLSASILRNLTPCGDGIKFPLSVDVSKMPNFESQHVYDFELPPAPGKGGGHGVTQ